MTSTLDRRDFLKQSLRLGSGVLLAGPLETMLARAADKSASKIKLGLCTYRWGEDWDLPTAIANCEKAEVLGVELRTGHKHGVEPGLSAAQRKDVKKRFADSPVAFIGLGSNESFHDVDLQAVRQAIENAKGFIKLSHDVGGSGVKVKPNDLPKGVPQKKTTEQIGRSLNELGRFAADFGQQVRLEVHGRGGAARLPVIKEIMDVADHPQVAVCWNCNDEDLLDGGLEHNFNLVRKRLGATTHIHELNGGKYPFQDLIRLLARADYAGWLLLECGQTVKDGVAAMIEQRHVFERMVANARRT
jgi:sugar phosphate isomerase/epimerase